MPFRAPSICSCGRAVASGQRCACKIVVARERAKATDAKRGSSRARGYDSKWDRERAAFLKANPICNFCPAPSKVVDHKTPHKGDMRVFWDRSNWQGLCTHCHSSTKQRQERGEQ
jgi:5-methylcytosine-specific restriction endonuclease McrA